MKIKWALLLVLSALAALLSGCDPLLVFDTKGPQAERQANDILLSIWIMAGVLIAVLVILVVVLVKYRASKTPDDYEPPHIEGNKWVELICVGIPVIIVAVLSVVSVKSNYIVESSTNEDVEPLVIYASSSDWKWHFSYPEQDIETVNYLYIPTDRPIEFKLYSYGPITSFWIPQLGGQKYAMADMTTTLWLEADQVGEMIGRNANFSGKGFAENTFSVNAVPEEDFNEWVQEVYEHEKDNVLTEEKFNELLEPGHLGQMTFKGTHLEFSPAPVEHNEHQKGSSDEDSNKEDHSEHEGH